MAISIEIGAWVEGTVSKRDGKGLRKVWVTGAKAQGEPLKLSAIVRDGTRESHVLTLRVNTPEERTAALEALTQAVLGLTALSEHLAKPAAAPRTPKPPTRPTPTQPAQNTRPAAPAATRNPAPKAPVAAPTADFSADDWFAKVMAGA